MLPPSGLLSLFCRCWRAPCCPMTCTNDNITRSRETSLESPSHGGSRETDCAARSGRTVLEIDGLQTHFFAPDRRGARRRRRVLCGAQRRDAGRGRRVGLRQERDRALDPAPRRRPAGSHRRRRDPLRGPQPPRAQRARDGAGARQRDLDDLPGADDLAEPALHRGRQIAEAIALHQGLSRRDALGPRRRDAAPRPYPRAGEARCAPIRTSSRAACASG